MISKKIFLLNIFYEKNVNFYPTKIPLTPLGIYTF